MTAYVLTDGDYSDYCVIGVTLNKETAEQFAKLHCCRIEEFDTETIQYCSDKQLYCVIMYNDGTVHASVKTPYADEIKHAGIGIIEKITLQNRLSKLGYAKPTTYYRLYTAADDVEHAQKIFFDKLAEYRAKEKENDLAD